MNIFFNIDFWSAVSGFVGSVMLFFFQLPPRVSAGGAMHIILEGHDEKEAKKYKKYQFLSYLALGLIALAFLLQLIKVIV